MSTIAATNLKNASSGSNNIVLGTDGSSTLTTAKVATLADSAGANTSTPAEIASGRAKAWVNFNGTGTVAIRASYNVSSITDHGVGTYTVNFTTALADANYALLGTVGATSGGAVSVFPNDNTTPRTTTAARIVTVSTAGSAADSEQVAIAIFR